MHRSTLVLALLVGVILIFGRATAQRTDKTTMPTSKVPRPAHVQHTSSTKSSSRNSTKPAKSGTALPSVEPDEGSRAALEAMEVERVTRLEQEYIQAEIKKDKAWLKEYFADDLTGVTSEGVFEDKARLIDHCLEPTNTLESKTYDQLTVRPYGDVMVVTGKLSQKGQSNNSEYNVQRTFTHVWVNRLGHWQQVAIHESPILPGGTTSQAATPSARQLQTPEALAPSPSQLLSVPRPTVSKPTSP